MYSSHSNLSVKGEKQGERQRRAVSFRPMVSCMKIRQRGNAADIYYQAEELEEILYGALDTLEKMEAGVALDDVNDCGRGLERHLSRNKARIVERRNSSSEAVIHGFQQTTISVEDEGVNGEFDKVDKSIAERYTKVAEECRNEALLMGLQDRVEASELLSTDCVEGEQQDNSPCQDDLYLPVKSPLLSRGLSFPGAIGP